MKEPIKAGLLLAIVALCLFEYILRHNSDIFQKYGTAFLQIQWMLLISVTVWCASFLFSTFSMNDLVLIGLLIIIVAAYFIGYAAWPARNATTFLAGVTLGKGAKYFLENGRWKAESRTISAVGSQEPEVSSQNSEARFFLIGLVALLAFASWWHLDVSDNYYHGRRWMGLWKNPNDYGLLMAAGLILSLGLLATKRHKRHKGREDRELETGNRKFLRSLRLFAAKQTSSANPNVGQASRLSISDANGNLSASPTRAGETPALRFILFIAAGMMGVGLLFSYSRGAWVGTVVGLLYLAKHTKSKSRKRKAEIIWYLPPLVALAAAVVVIFWNTPHTAPWYFQRLDFSRGSVQHRLAAWRAGFEIMRDHPFGVGWNKTVEIYQRNYSPPEGGAAAIATNDYLMLGTQLGWPGLLCFVSYAALCIRGRARRSVRAANDNEDGVQGTARLTLDSLRAACRAGALTMLVAFWFDGGLFKLATASVLWILLELGRADETLKTEG